MIGQGTGGIGVTVTPSSSGITANGTAISGGTNKRVLFDDNGVLGESANLTFDKTTSTLTIGTDVNLVRDSANILSLRNSTNAQIQYNYGTYTDASNYERAIVGYNNVAFEFGSEIAGTGSSRNIRIKAAGASGAIVFSTNGSDKWYFSNAGDLLAVSDAAYDIGASSSARPRNLFIGGYFSGIEQTAPAAPAANGYRIFAQDNGAGKTQLMVIFGSGAAQQLAIEP